MKNLEMSLTKKIEKGLNYNMKQHNENSNDIKATVDEIFSSIQGEGLYVGTKQLFIRFCGCNLKCDYCDTQKAVETFENCGMHEFTPEDLRNHLDGFDLNAIHSISITGGEPLMWADFLEKFLPLLHNKIYLETNATLSTHLNKVIDYIDIISADIKLPSASGVENSFAAHDEFFKFLAPYNKETFAKIVFDENIFDDEIEKCVTLAEKYNLELILQPKMNDMTIALSETQMQNIFDKFLKKHKRTRLIPQVHKFLQVL